jgi:hypothetical protein
VRITGFFRFKYKYINLNQSQPKIRYELSFGEGADKKAEVIRQKLKRFLEMILGRIRM